MVTIPIKAISVNEAYIGRRFATPALKGYKKAVILQLPRIKVPKGKLEVKYIFGLSSKGSDVDNVVKAFTDCLSEAYGFNDNLIYRAEIEKRDTKKGEEYIMFEIKEYGK